MSYHSTGAMAIEAAFQKPSLSATAARPTAPSAPSQGTSPLAAVKSNKLIWVAALGLLGVGVLLYLRKPKKNPAPRKKKKSASISVGEHYRSGAGYASGMRAWEVSKKSKNTTLQSRVKEALTDADEAARRTKPESFPFGFVWMSTPDKELAKTLWGRSGSKSKGLYHRLSHHSGTLNQEEAYCHALSDSLRKYGLKLYCRTNLD
jgi:hypothetical protein